MQFANRISKWPRSHDADRSKEISQLFERESDNIKDLLATIGGSSPFLHQAMEKDAAWLISALHQSPEAAFADVLADAGAFELADMADGLRRAKRRVSLLVGLADLAGVWSLEKVTDALTKFADLAVDFGVQSLVGAEIDRGKLPGTDESDKATAGGMCVLAMGKMGAGELNYSSDIDLICLFDETRFQPDDYADARASFVRVTRRLTALLSELTGAGYVFRTDLRLRPDPSVTPVCLSMETALQYYESVGRTWERAAYIKARPCAGDIEAGWQFLERLRPFIWRRHLDFAAIQDAHDMRLRIRKHKGFHGPIVLEGHNIKLGAGGIREIEFFTQTRQIIAGGRDKSLRVRGTLEGLDRLADKGWVPADVANQLKADYRAHREVEHRLQMINDAQTHDLPKTPEGFERLAALSGRETSEMRQDLSERLDRVAKLTEGFFAPDTDETAEVELAKPMAEIVAKWPTYPSLRSSRAIEIFETLRPEILMRLQQAADPDDALIQFDRFLAGLPGGVQVFSLFQANPQLIDLIVDIAASAPRLAHYLGRNAQVFDAVIGGDFFAPWPDKSELANVFTAALSVADDYEGKLDAARRTMKEWHFRVGVHHLRGLIDADVAGAQYADLADSVVNSVWPVVVEDFVAKHGEQPGRGAVVLGMGSLGSARLTATSDLDLIVIYDPCGVDYSEGRRPLATRAYFARLTQALVTALGAQMSEGRLYEVDMRLRPSGRQGPVATSLQAFKTYQLQEAWTWEHLALTRARIVVGNIELGEQTDQFRQDILLKERQAAAIIGDVQDMRERLAKAKPGQGDWDAKNGPGRLQDIDLVAQTAALLAGDPARDTASQLAAGVRIGWIEQEECDQLLSAYGLMWHLQAAARLLTGSVLDPSEIGRGGLAFLLRETGTSDADGLSFAIHSATQGAADVIENTLGRAANLT